MKNWIYGLLAKFSHVLLSGALGAVAIAEAIRLGNYDKSDSFIIGPGGYMMAVGISLVCFSCIGGIGGLIAWSRSRPSPSISSVPKDPISPQPARAQSERGGGEQKDYSRMVKPIVSFLLCLGYILLIKPMGFTFATLLFLAAGLWLLENPFRRIALTCIVMFPILAFGLPLIGLSMPKGILGL